MRDVENGKHILQSNSHLIFDGSCSAFCLDKLMRLNLTGNRTVIDHIRLYSFCQFPKYHAWLLLEESL